MAHLVYIKAKNDTKFNYASFAAYKNKEGKTVQLIDPDGQPVDKWELYQSMHAFDLENEHDARVWEYLKDHPLVHRGGFELIDARKGEQESAAKAILSAEAVTIANKLTPNEYDDMARLIGISENFDSVIKKARVLRYASEMPEKFLEVFNNVDKDYYVFLKKASQKGLIAFVNGVWKYKANSIGLTDEQAIEWFKDNKDVYALMKQDMRGGKKLTATNEMVQVEIKPKSKKAVSK